MKLYSVRDKKAQQFATPMAMPTDAHCLRAFQAEVNRAEPGNTLYTHSEDFQLYSVGEFQPETGEITPQVTLLIEAQALKKPA